MIAAQPVSREKILTTARRLPAAPQVLAGLCELLQDTNSDLEQVAGQIRVDAALSARVIRISNSTVYGGTRIGSVNEAVNRVGFSEILRLVGIATVAGLAERSLMYYGIAADRMRESLLLHALAAEALAERCGLDARQAYAGGLLRSLGMMVLDRVARDRESVSEIYDERRFPNYGRWEEALFGLRSREVTTMVLDEWRFSPELVAALDAHFLTVEEDHSDRLAVAINLAGSIVTGAGLALPGEAEAWAPTSRKYAALGLDEPQLHEIAGEVSRIFARQREAFA